jgi:hypothetical protein
VVGKQTLVITTVELTAAKIRAAIPPSPVTAVVPVYPVATGKCVAMTAAVESVECVLWARPAKTGNVPHAHPTVKARLVVMTDAAVPVANVRTARSVVRTDNAQIRLPLEVAKANAEYS